MGLEKLTLNDIAALIVQIGPTDRADLARVREALNDITECSSSSVQRPVSEAIQKIDRIMGGKVSDSSGLLAEVGGLIEEAIDAMEENGRGEMRSPVPEPDQGPVVKSATENEQSDSLPVEADPAILEEFITESRELIASAEVALLDLETDPENAEAINTVFRAFHTIKGTSAFLGLDLVSDLAHRAESLLSRIRDREIRCTGGYADLALRSVDMLKELIEGVQGDLGGQPMAAPDGLDDLMVLLVEPEAACISDESDETAETPLRLGDILVTQGEADHEEIEAAAINHGDQPIGQALRKQRSVAGLGRAAESSVRVRADRLDHLIELVGELVIGHSMVEQDETVNSVGHHELLRKVSHMGKMVRELQGLSLSMRMVRFKATFQKMARLVRDLARKQGIMVDFIPVGEETEIDRNMVDVINDPLVHLVRNAVDHGIEPPEERARNGKPRKGVLLLKAYHSGGSVVVKIQDDGRGLNRDKIVRKAIAKGLIESDKGMSEGEVFNLIFQPGFSTADRVTDVSGRGVGLDVLRRGVEALRGRIEVSSEFGKGCSFSVRLPLTMAITDGMLVKVGGQRYILPTININMSFRPDAQALSTIAGRGEMVIFQGELMPIFRLHRLFDIDGAVEDPTDGLLIIIGDNDHRCALLVDELLGKQQVVAKSLGDGIGKVQGVSGGAILGDGRVGLILEPQGIAALARQASDPGVAKEVVCKSGT